MKKLFAALPMIGLILGAVVIATEIRKPMSLGQCPLEQNKIQVSATIQSTTGTAFCPLETTTASVCANK